MASDGSGAGVGTKSDLKEVASLSSRPLHLERLSWSQLVDELRGLADQKPSGGRDGDPEAVLHNLFTHQVELEMQNRELRDSQQRLEASRARYADLYDFAPVGYLTIGDDERIQEINLTGAALLGRDRADIVGRTFIGILPPGDGAMVFHEHLRRCIEDGCRVDDEIEFLPRGRPPVLLHMTSAPVLDGDGKATACHTAITDVTDRRRAEDAERASRMKEEFLGTVSHELRTPLAAILAWVNILQAREERGAELDRNELRHALAVIARNASLQGQLIEDILDVSRVLAGKLRVDVEEIDLGPVVRESIESLRPAAEAKGIALSASVAPHAMALADAVRLAQVLANLLSNALKFTPAGGTIEVGVTKEPSCVRIAIRDTGRGIAEKELTRVFERFHQVDGSTNRTAGGLGLGLALVDHIVRAHGGDVVALSPGLGLGATFVVRLRVAGGAAIGAPEPQVARMAGVLLGRTILCVDDDADVLEVTALVLREHGAVVLTARTTAGALVALVSSPPDVVISDIGLPGKDGYELLRQIRMLPGDVGRVPVIAVTGYADAASASHARAEGFQQFLRKPVSDDALVRAVSAVAVSINRS